MSGDSYNPDVDYWQTSSLAERLVRGKIVPGSGCALRLALQVLALLRLNLLLLLNRRLLLSAFMGKQRSSRGHVNEPRLLLRISGPPRNE